MYTSEVCAICGEELPPGYPGRCAKHPEAPSQRAVTIEITTTPEGAKRLAKLKSVAGIALMRVEVSR